MTERSLLAAGVLAAGIAIGGGLVGWGFARGRSADRYVEVKGLAEREVTAICAVAAAFVAAGRRSRSAGADYPQLRTSPCVLKRHSNGDA